MPLHAEISIVPIGKGKDDTGMSKEVAAAFEAINNTPGIKATLTALGTQVEASTIDSILEAIRAAHSAAKSAGCKRIISSVRIDERLDKTQTLEDKVSSVLQKLKE
jgi:uncharacterized protein (TIGR00106 family)